MNSHPTTISRRFSNCLLWMAALWPWFGGNLLADSASTKNVGPLPQPATVWGVKPARYGLEKPYFMVDNMSGMTQRSQTDSLQVTQIGGSAGQPADPVSPDHPQGRADSVAAFLPQPACDPADRACRVVPLARRLRLDRQHRTGGGEPLPASDGCPLHESGRRAAEENPRREERGTESGTVPGGIATYRPATVWCGNAESPGFSGRFRFLQCLTNSGNSSDRNRTCDLGLMNPALYQLSYAAVKVGFRRAKVYPLYPVWQAGICIAQFFHTRCDGGLGGWHRSSSRSDFTGPLRGTDANLHTLQTFPSSRTIRG